MEINLEKFQITLDFRKFSFIFAVGRNLKTDWNMKKIILTLIGLAAFAAALSAGDKPIAFDKLPSAAKAFIETNFSGEKASLVLKDDDLIRPDYTVVLMNGIKIEFDHSGALTQISSPDGIPAEQVPVSIRNYVQSHYPNAGYLEFEIGKHTYEVTLTNRMELKFNKNFHVIEVDH